MIWALGSHKVTTYFFNPLILSRSIKCQNTFLKNVSNCDFKTVIQDKLEQIIYMSCSTHRHDRFRFEKRETSIYHIVDFSPNAKVHFSLPKCYRVWPIFQHYPWFHTCMIYLQFLWWLHALQKPLKPLSYHSNSRRHFVLFFSPFLSSRVRGVDSGSALEWKNRSTILFFSLSLKALSNQIHSSVLTNTEISFFKMTRFLVKKSTNLSAVSVNLS